MNLKVENVLILFLFLNYIELFAKGTLYITGDMITDRPNVKVNLEKTGEFSSVDIKAFLGAYLEANKPHDSNLKNKLSDMPSLSYQGTNNAINGSKNTPSKQEVLKKLEEFGVSIFLPDGKINNLDWVIKSMIYIYFFFDRSNI